MILNNCYCVLSFLGRIKEFVQDIDVIFRRSELNDDDLYIVMYIIFMFTPRHRTKCKYSLNVASDNMTDHKHQNVHSKDLNCKLINFDLLN